MAPANLAPDWFGDAAMLTMPKKAERITTGVWLIWGEITCYLNERGTVGHCFGGSLLYITIQLSCRDHTLYYI